MKAEQTKEMEKTCDTFNRVHVERIVRRRVKGFKLPPNTVCVSRPSKWGNPFKVGHHYKKGGGGVPRMGWSFLYLEAYEGHQDNTYTTLKNVEECIEWYKWYLDNSPMTVKIIRSELRGKNLACWCKEGEPCHADVLLEIANT